MKAASQKTTNGNSISENYYYDSTLADRALLDKIISGNENNIPMRAFDMSYDPIIKQTICESFLMICIGYAFYMFCIVFNYGWIVWYYTIWVQFLVIIPAFIAIFMIMNANRNCVAVSGDMQLQFFNNGILLCPAEGNLAHTKMFTWDEVIKNDKSIKISSCGLFAENYYELTMMGFSLGCCIEGPFMMDTLFQEMKRYRQDRGCN